MPQASYAALTVLCVTDRTDVQPFATAEARAQGLWPAAIQPHIALVCVLIVSTLVFRVNTRIATHLPTPKEWKAELADPLQTVYPQSQPLVNHRLDTGQGKSAGETPTS